MTNKRKCKRFKDFQKPTYARIKVVDFHGWHDVLDSLVERHGAVDVLRAAMVLIDRTRH